MAYRLRCERNRKHGKTGEPYKEVSFHKGYLMGTFPEATQQPEKAMTFRTKVLAEVYSRNKGLGSYGYKPERIPTTKG